MKFKGLDFLGKAFIGMDLSPSEQKRLDILLYGEPLEGPGPWMETTKGRNRKIMRHIHIYGYGRECPVCKEVHKVPR